ncbi:sensor histidine kinase N-terminal domain-containing protein [Verrucomicrobium spinosum]|uniref:sensor histidine kinase N-terminal domain-containing protein n=1 Tax=Verrucomicrobium spinosum TaxID=2736 RepID=UPI0009461667|nr:sensor histidine kinase N-terminal domain-containing protein [Verrucomicrobium spinosum]
MTSLLTRLTLALCVAAVVLLPAGGGLIYFTAERLLLRNFDAVLAAKADALVTTSEMERRKLEIDLEVQEFAGFGSAAGGDYFEFRTPSGSLLARSPSLRRDRLPSLPEPLTRKPLNGYLTLPDGRPGRALWLAVPVKSRDQPTGPAWWNWEWPVTAPPWARPCILSAWWSPARPPWECSWD